MLLTLMFNNVVKAEHPDFYEQFERYITALAARYPNVVPGDPLRRFRLSICLTFDDAYADFYFKVFPLLKRLKIKAVLAVQTAYILDDNAETTAARMAIPTLEAMDATVWPQAPFCTWRELQEMVDSGYVIIASHTQHHVSAKDPKLDMTAEYVDSKHVLATQLSRPIDTFIYHYGHFTRAAHQYLTQHYRYIMRIHNAVNFNWGGVTQLLYRKNGDPLCLQQRLPDVKMCAYFMLKWFYHRLLGR